MVDEDKAPADEQQDATVQRDAVVQRVRVGLTGLAAVFLLTLLAASIFSLLGQDDQHNAAEANGAATANMAAGEDSPKEPLAELGVAPGGNTPKPTTPAPSSGPAVTPTPAPASVPPMPDQASPPSAAVTGGAVTPAPAAPRAIVAHHQASPAPQG